MTTDQPRDEPECGWRLGLCTGCPKCNTAARTTPDNPATSTDTADNLRALKEILDTHAGREHSADGPVMQCLTRILQAHRTMLTTPYPDVRGYCPACHNQTLFLGDGGYITCSLIGCPQPDAASTLLERRDAEAPCGLVTLGIGVTPLGPCTVVGPHEVHKAGNGACWWPAQNGVVTFTGGQTDEEIERFRTKWREHAARPVAVDTEGPNTP